MGRNRKVVCTFCAVLGREKQYRSDHLAAHIETNHPIEAKRFKNMVGEIRANDSTMIRPQIDAVASVVPIESSGKRLHADESDCDTRGPPEKVLICQSAESEHTHPIPTEQSTSQPVEKCAHHGHKGMRCTICGSVTRSGRTHTAAACMRARTMKASTTADPRTTINPEKPRPATKFMSLSDIFFTRRSLRKVNALGVLTKSGKPKFKYERRGTEKLIASQGKANEIQDDDVTKFFASGIVMDATGVECKVNFFAESVEGIPPEIAPGKFVVIGLFNANFTLKRGTDSYISVNSKGGWAIFDQDISAICTSGTCPADFREAAKKVVPGCVAVAGSNYAVSTGLRAVTFSDCSPWICDLAEELKEYSRTRGVANDEQNGIMDRLIAAVDLLKGKYRPPQKSNLWSITGTAGTGKTTVLRGVVAYARSIGINALVTAPAKLAASNYRGGLTLHSAFHITLSSNESTNCYPSAEAISVIANLRLLVIDEAWACSKYVLNAVDAELRKYHNHNLPFGGIMVVFCGDPNQLLPIPEKGQIDSDITMCDMLMWKEVVKFNLEKHVRTVDPTLIEFQELVRTHSSVSLPEKLYTASKDDLLEFVYPKVQTRFNDTDYFKDRVILCPFRRQVNDWNRRILKMLPGDEQIVDEGYKKRYELALKVGCPVVVVKNLQSGLCNGTRMKCLEFTCKYVKARIITGMRAGEDVTITRTDVGGSWRFPLELAFAMTIHKSQGQTLGIVGVDLENDLFAHGHLYVASTRARHIEDLLIFCEKMTIANPVNLNFINKTEVAPREVTKQTSNELTNLYTYQTTNIC